MAEMRNRMMASKKPSVYFVGEQGVQRFFVTTKEGCPVPPEELTAYVNVPELLEWLSRCEGTARYSKEWVERFLEEVQ